MTSQLATRRPPAFYVPKDMKPSILQPGHRQYAAFFLNLLFWKWMCWQADDHGWIRLKRDYITRIIPIDLWIPIRERLVSKHIIYCSGTWQPGKRAMGYQLGEGFREAKRIPCSNATLARRIEEVYRSESVPLQSVHQWLREKLDRLDLDMGKAETIISTLKPDVGSTLSIEEYQQMMAASCQRIANGDHWFTCDRFGRVHTPITSLAKELRACLLIGGQRLVNIDLANSQPLFAGMLAREYFSSKGKAARIRNRKFDPKGRPYHLRKLAGKPSDRPDIERYMRICEAGRLYETMAAARGTTRGQEKPRWITAMFSKRGHRGWLAKEFPGMGEMLEALKAKDYRHAACLMQNAESSIFIGGVCERIRRERPDLPVFTIHDSVLTILAATDYVKSVIMDEFATAGVEPTLRLEEC